MRKSKNGCWALFCSWIIMEDEIGVSRRYAFVPSIKNVVLCFLLCCSKSFHHTWFVLCRTCTPLVGMVSFTGMRLSSWRVVKLPTKMKEKSYFVNRGKFGVLVSFIGSKLFQHRNAPDGCRSRVLKYHLLAGGLMHVA